MKSHRHLLSIAALASTVIISMGVAMMPAAHQPPAEPPAIEMPQMPPAPGEHHKWLQQLVGEWTVESEMIGPGMPEMKSTGTDSVRSIGGRWVVAELKGEMPEAMGGGSMHAVLTLGYDAEKGKYMGTWIDSMHDLLWNYTGTMDPTGKILTLEAEGPNMMDPTSKEKIKYRDVIEIKGPDHRTWTSSAFMDGEWVQFMIANYRRVK